MNRDGVGAEIEDGRDFFIRLAVDDHLQHLEFTLRESSVAFTLQRGRLLNLRIEDSFSGGDFSNRRAEFQVESALEHVAFRAGLNGLTNPGALGVHAEHQNICLGRILHNLARCLQAVHAGQSAIHDHDSGMQFFREFDGSLAIAGFTHYIHVLFIFENPPKSAPDQAVVIDQQDCDLLFHKTPLSPWERRGAPAFRPAGVAKIRVSRPSAPNAHASPPTRSRACSDVPEIRRHDLRLPVRAHRARIATAPRPASPPNAWQRYSALPAPRGKCAHPPRYPQETVRLASHRIWQFPSAVPPWVCTSRECSQVRPRRASPDA